MSAISEVKLNIGAGKTRIPGFINIDIAERAELSLDIGTTPLPFEDSSVDLIFSYHTMEHVPNYLFALSEIYRVLKHGGIFLVGLPYVTLTEYHLINPYHLHNFSEHSFAFFEPRQLKGSAAETNDISFVRVFHRFHYIGIFKLLPPPFRTWCRRHLLNVVRKVDMGLIAFKGTREMGRMILDSHKLQKQFDKCVRARIPYEGRLDARPVGGLSIQTIRKARAWWNGH